MEKTNSIILWFHVSASFGPSRKENTEMKLKYTGKTVKDKSRRKKDLEEEPLATMQVRKVSAH